MPSRVTPCPQVLEDRDQELDHVRPYLDRRRGLPEQAVALSGYQLHFLFQLADRVDRLEIEPPLQGTGHLVHAAVASIGGADHVESGPGVEHPVGPVELRDDHHFLGEDADERILDLRRAAGDLLEPHKQSLAHRHVQRRGHQRPQRRPLGQQQRVVPGVLDMVLGGPRGSLDGVDRGARDRRGQQFREHRLGRSRLTHEHEPPVAAQADDGALDHEVVAIELAADRGTLAAAKKRPDCAG